jgi:hypothetical protein
MTINPITRLQNLIAVQAQALAALKEREAIRRDMQFITLAKETR